MAKIDDSVKKKVPELRFKGFTDEWEQRKLGDEVRIVMGQSPNSENYTDDPNDYILVQGNADMKNGRVLPRVWTTQVTKQAEKDDLILSVRAPVGDIGKTAYDVVIGRGVAAIKGNEFIFQNLGKMKSDGYWTRYSTGSTFESINSTDIKEAIISVPAIEEQDKIGSFFKQLDNTIALHQRKLDLLKEQKKGYLQKMFPKNGAKVPELRFAGFADAWEERKLSDIADRFDNLRVPITASDRKPGDTPYYGANGIQDYVEGFTHNGEFILVAEDGANDLKNYPVQYVNGKVWVNNHAHVLQGKKTITDNKFLMNAIKNFNIEPFLVGGGRAKLNADVMMKLNILLPTFVEQEKIGSLFSLLDKTIALHQRKLDLLKEQKKGYLQKMFV
ncbi:restriction endonuclease subunit S [Enterococcus faecalis]|uniref:restriction endonuclease subunit S n=1 Tax=Enterococcus faecalis TaxID=1351 RepID=UPI00177B38C3|nr:restriction endonuclease subunit S [Enterococcus faecalis]MBD9857887.1 restriction endonuclease subunit S [Enterococcus faecalis]